MPDTVDTWLADPTKPPPSAVELAVHFALANGAKKWDRPGRIAILQVAALVVALDAALRLERESARSYAAALHDSAKTNYLAIDRLSKLEALRAAAIAGDLVAIARESQKLREARS